MTEASSQWLTVTFYRFVSLSDSDCQALQSQLRNQCQQGDITGTILLAAEGINATLCGQPAPLRELMAQLQADKRFAGMPVKESWSAARSLSRLKVRIKPEIIRMQQPDIDPAGQAGEYVEPADWNALISRKDVVLIDTRNDYEVAVGRFKGAIDPGTKHFSELPQWLAGQPTLKTRPAVAMYCTGGIRCEKSTALLRARGFDRVYHLKGGILKYLETVDPQDSLWQGECFVFDDRVALNHQLAEGEHELCAGCGHPLSERHKRSERFVAGHCCDYCFERNGMPAGEQSTQR